jgi:hypothetical protein
MVGGIYVQCKCVILLECSCSAQTIFFVLEVLFDIDLRKMYLGLTDLAKGLLGDGVSAGNHNALTNSKGGDHHYTRGEITDRSPCPGLNALANQGYLFV